jgi:hypothetical protein
MRKDLARDEAEKRHSAFKAATIQAATAALNYARHDTTLHQTHARGGLHGLTNNQKKKNFHKQAREVAYLKAAL